MKKINKRNQEVVTSSFSSDWKNEVNSLINVVPIKGGFLTKRKGFNTFGEMVDVFWNINKNNKKYGITAEYTVILPLKGTKLIYKKTLNPKHRV